MYVYRSDRSALFRLLYFELDIFESTISHGYAVRPVLYFDHFHIFDSRTSNSFLRPFVKSGLIIGRDVQVEVKFGQKSRSKV